MNNRQKAKHWKRLYESYKLKKVPIVREYTIPRHYASVFTVNKREFYDMGIHAEILVAQKLAGQMVDAVQRNMTAEEVPELEAVRYRVDAWFQN